MSELGEVRASLARVQRELDAAQERLDAIESTRTGPTKTALVPRVIERQRRQLILACAFSSAATAILLGLGALVFSKPDPPLAASRTAPVPPDIPPPPLPVSVAAAEPPTPPPTATPPPDPTPTFVAEPPALPRAPRRVSPPLAARDDAPKRARPDDSDMGMLTIVCLPVKCDSIVDNGTPLGPGHIFSRPVPAGRHQLTLHAPNGVMKTITVEVRPEQLKDLRISMGSPSDVF